MIPCVSSTSSDLSDVIASMQSAKDGAVASPAMVNSFFVSMRDATASANGMT
jgi:hypothetical protein